MGIADVARAMQEAERRRLIAAGGDPGAYPVSPAVKSVADAITGVVTYPREYMEGRATGDPVEWATGMGLNMMGTGTAFPAAPFELRAGARPPKGAKGPKPLGVLYETQDALERAVGMQRGGAYPEEIFRSTGLAFDPKTGNWGFDLPAPATVPEIPPAASGGDALLPGLGADETTAKPMTAKAAKAEAVAAVEEARAAAARAGGKEPGFAVPSGVGAGSRVKDWSKVVPEYPEGFSDPQHFTDQYNRFLDLVDKGAASAPWYDESGKLNLAMAGGDVHKAQQAAGYQAVTSAETDVTGNFGFAANANDQAAVFGPEGIKTGMRPNEMQPRLQDIANAPPGGVLGVIMPWGHKTRNFARDLMTGGGYGDIPTGPGELAVNDRWHLRALGYSEEQIKRAASSPGLHLGAWNMMEDIVPQAQQRAVAKGATPGSVTQPRLQAPAWVAIRNEAGKGDLGKNTYETAAPKYTASSAAESAPAEALQQSGEFPGFDRLPWNDRVAIENEVRQALSNDYGGNVFQTGMGGQTMPMLPGMSVFKNPSGEIAFNPNTISPVVRGRRPLEEGGTVGEASGIAGDAAAAAEGLVRGQGSYAWTLKGNPGAPQRATRITNFDMGRQVSDDEMKQVAALINQNMTEVKLTKNGEPVTLGGTAKITPKNTGNGFELVFHNEGTPPTPEQMAAFYRASDQIRDQLGARGMTNHTSLTGDYGFGSAPWTEPGAPGAFVTKVPERLQNMTAELMPKVAGRMEDIYGRVRRQLGGKENGQFMETLATLAGGSWQGVLDAIKKGKLGIGGAVLIGVASQILDEKDAVAGDPGEPPATRVY